MQQNNANDLNASGKNSRQTESDKELEIENGFFTVDEDLSKHKEINSPTENQKENKILDTDEISKNKLENIPGFNTDEDTIDAAFNSALGITKKDNITGHNSEGMYDENAITNNIESDEDEKDII